MLGSTVASHCHEFPWRQGLSFATQDAASNSSCASSACPGAARGPSREPTPQVFTPPGHQHPLPVPSTGSSSPSLLAWSSVLFLHCHPVHDGNAFFQASRQTGCLSADGRQVKDHTFCCHPALWIEGRCLFALLIFSTAFGSPWRQCFWLCPALFLRCFPAYRSPLAPHPERLCCWLTRKIPASK